MRCIKDTRDHFGNGGMLLLFRLIIQFHKQKLGATGTRQEEFGESQKYVEFSNTNV